MVNPYTLFYRYNRLRLAILHRGGLMKKAKLQLRLFLDMVRLFWVNNPISQHYKNNAIACYVQWQQYLRDVAYAKNVAADYKVNTQHYAVIQTLISTIEANYAKALAQNKYPYKQHLTELKQIMAAKIIFYRYWFSGKTVPITIEARSANEADRKIEDLATYLLTVGYDCSKIINTTCEEPIEGISTKTVDNITYVWVGASSKNGWQQVD
jgi:hypothetical protein